MCSYHTIRQNITLNIYLDKEMKAEGSLYLDDGETFAYQTGEFIYLLFSFKEMNLQIRQLNTSYIDKDRFFSKLFFEEIKIYGMKLSNGYKLVNSLSKDIVLEVKQNYLSIKGFNNKIGEDYSLKLEYFSDK